MSGNADDGLLEEWLNVNMPSGTIIGDPKWWAKKIRNVLGYENANLDGGIVCYTSKNALEVLKTSYSGINFKGISKEKLLGTDVPLYTNPQPTSQEYCCIDSWEKAKSKAWNNRDFKLCKCDRNESCSHCYPSDFKDGGKWYLCKPMKESK